MVGFDGKRLRFVSAIVRDGFDIMLIKMEVDRRRRCSSQYNMGSQIED